MLFGVKWNKDFIIIARNNGEDRNAAMVTKNLNVMQRSFAGCYPDLLWDMLLH